ncbi:tRNA (cytosine(72)-C(5))-methyltransferase NSUN6-like isoform X3 [Biomphalaria glabrata]|uniref:tRNA (Cytosine(72)-C(5))-methyltransferase NSUN6-like isoform X3 n=1 Tax=Biomphalaria glabrata TaxID=6526 RepID=A0A9W3A2B8_BIOGL|nr:tRNA (cytosine(72)-C(5))-methyltransferase NSUN6-like isoform X3 [Biomphalaria glabrata]
MGQTHSWRNTHTHTHNIYILNDEHFKQLLEVLTLPPLYTTLRINSVENDPDNNILLEEIQLHLKKQTDALCRPEYNMFIHPVLKDCLLIQNRGPKTIDVVDKEIIVDLSCGMAVLRGAHVFKVGIMGAPMSLRAGDVVSVYADLDGHCLKGTATCYSNQKLFVGNGVAHVSRSDLFNSQTLQSGIGILMTHPVYEAPSLAEMLTVRISSQNLPSIACVYALDPQEGEIILDMCAAPGGKTTHIAGLIGDKGLVIALDKSSQRVKKMQTLKKKNIEMYVFDSTKAWCPSADGSNRPPYSPETFDRILVDAPCSALGQRPCYKNEILLNQLRSYPVIQHQLLKTAVKLLKPGGVMVYSTCTITKEENEDQVSRLLATNPQIELIHTPYKLGGDALPTCDLSSEDKSKVQRFDPSFLYSDDKDLYNVDTIGFFIAKFQKLK